MRIIGYIEDIADCKVTVFEQGLRYMVKFEDGLYEQSFKFRQSETINGLRDIQALIDAPFIEEVKARFVEMRTSVRGLMERYLEDEEEDFEEII